MDTLKPIHTKTAECQDCYKCLRHCPVKAVKIHEGHACIEHELCIMCGNCVQVCPVNAKIIRDDLERAKMLLRIKPKVFVSLAPSYITEFADYKPEQVIQGLKQLGFYGVSETALGAQELSAAIAEDISEQKQKVYISSACPTVVELVKKYYPPYSDYVTDTYSPVMVHCKILREKFGDDIAVVFVGPCISKKTESDLYNELLDVSLTFEELRRWWREMQIEPGDTADKHDAAFLPYAAKEGAMYPVDGGMVAGIKANCPINNTQFMTFSGIKNIQNVLDDLDSITFSGPLFLELLACEGGCVNGPGACEKGKTAVKRYTVIENTEYCETDIPRQATVDVRAKWDILPAKKFQHDEEQMRQALAQVGKVNKEDELNCGGCGYDSCREFAKALIEGRSETNMCVSYMRKLAHKKAAALLRCMPSGLVIVDNNLRVVECNRPFAEIMGDRSILAYEARPGMDGADLTKILNFHEMFSNVLNKAIDIEKDVKAGNAILHVTVFTIEPYRLVGGIIRDITEPSVQKERVIEKTKAVIEKNLSTVQQIAYLLGENAAESEVLLNSIVKSFMVDSENKNGENG